MKSLLAKILKLVQNSMYAFSKRGRSEHSDAKNHTGSNNNKNARSQSISEAIDGTTQSKVMVLLQPIQQFVETVIQKTESAEFELKTCALAKSAHFELFTKQKSELSADERSRLQELVKDPVISEKLAAILPQSRLNSKSSRPPSASAFRDSVAAAVENSQPPPPSESSCSVTELEDFVYKRCCMGNGQQNARKWNKLALITTYHWPTYWL
jgi:hypothetical protein